MDFATSHRLQRAAYPSSFACTGAGRFTHLTMAPATMLLVAWFQDRNSLYHHSSETLGYRCQGQRCRVHFGDQIAWE